MGTVADGYCGRWVPWPMGTVADGYRGRWVPWPIGARARARAREWKTEIGNWKSEMRSGMTLVGHSTYPYSSCICSFFTAASLLFVHLKKCFCSCSSTFLSLNVMYEMIFSRSINTHTGDYGHPTAAIRRLHIMFYT